MDLLGTVFSYSQKAAAQYFLKQDGAKQLRLDLNKAVVDWVADLPKDCALLPDTIFEAGQYNQSPDSSARNRLASFLINRRPPSEAAWLDALLEQWHAVRKRIPIASERQQFYRIPETVAAAHLTRLARSLRRACQQSHSIFHGHVVDQLEQLEKLITANDKKGSVSTPPGRDWRFAAEPIHRRMLQDFGHRRAQYATDVVFDLRLSVSINYYELLRQTYVLERIDAGALLKDKRWKGIIINSAAGAGKSSFLINLAERHIDEGPTFFIDLSRGYSVNQSQQDLTLARLFKYSISGGHLEFEELNKISDSVLIIVDGLNEVVPAASEEVLFLTEEICRKYTSTRVVLADRIRPSEGGAGYYRGTVCHLIKSGENNVAETPFLADLLGRSEANTVAGTSSPPRVEAIGCYLVQRLRLSDQQIEVIAKGAMAMYRKFQGRSFLRLSWDSFVTPDLTKRMLQDGLIISIKDSDGSQKLVFRHQLLHDYLVSRYLSTKAPDSLSTRLLDAATFLGASIESVSLLLEMASSRPLVEAFFLRIYDWSYSAALRCLGDLSYLGHALPISRQLALAVSAMSAEKMFDPNRFSASRARTYLQHVANKDVLEFLECKSAEEVRQIVAKTEVTGHLIEWQRLFLSTEGSHVGDQEVLALTSPNPLVAWAAASTLRRMSLGEREINQVRTIYLTFLRAAEGFGASGRFAMEQIRWRATRVLSLTSDVAGLLLLKQAALTDPNGWVRYGACRGVIERSLIGGKSVLEDVAKWCLSGLLQSGDLMALRGLVTGYDDLRATAEWQVVMTSTLRTIYQERRDLLSSNSEWEVLMRKVNG